MNARRNSRSLIFIFSAFLSLLALFPARSAASSLTLAWEPNTEDDLAGYNLYYGRRSGDYDFAMDIGNATQYTVTGLESGTRYYFALTAYDTSGNESDYSEEVSGIPESSLDPLEVVRVTSPNGGETLVSGSTYTITWITNGTEKPVAKVILRYTRNGGRTWKRMDTLTDNTGSYDWTLPNVRRTKTRCKAKVVLKSTNGKRLGNDTSDGYFTIGPN